MPIKKKTKTIYITSNGTEFFSEKDAEFYEKIFSPKGFKRKTTVRIVKHIKHLAENKRITFDDFDYLLMTLSDGLDKAHEELYSQPEDDTSFSTELLNDVISEISSSLDRCLKRNPSLLKGIIDILCEETKEFHKRLN